MRLGVVGSAIRRASTRNITDVNTTLPPPGSENSLSRSRHIAIDIETLAPKVLAINSSSVSGDERAVFGPTDRVVVEVTFDRSMGSIHRYEFTTEVDGKVVVIGAVAVSLSGSGS